MKKLIITITILFLLVTMTGCAGSFGKLTLFQVEDGTASFIKGSSTAKQSSSDASW